MSGAPLPPRQERARSVLALAGVRLRALASVPGRRADRQVYRAELAGGQGCFVKVLDREDGYAREAGALRTLPAGVGPRLLAAADEQLALVTEAVSGPVAASLFPADPGDLLERCLASFRRLLGSGIDGPVDPVPVPAGEPAQRFLQCLARHAGYPAEALRACLAAEQPLLPCHGDLTPNNVLVTRDGVRFIDFEFFGVGQPLYDAASLCLSPSLNATIEHRLAMLARFTQAIAEAAARPVPASAVLAATVTWAVRFAERLHTGKPAVDAALIWQQPLRIAGEVTRRMAARPLPSAIQNDLNDL